LRLPSPVTLPEVYGPREAWERRVAESDVRLQWDPDHHPSGAKQERRAIQLGLRGAALARFADEWIVGVEDITPFVAEQRAQVRRGALEALMIPREDVYPVADVEVARKLGVWGRLRPHRELTRAGALS
jgi:hypothetical protein